MVLVVCRGSDLQSHLSAAAVFGVPSLSSRLTNSVPLNFLLLLVL